MTEQIKKINLRDFVKQPLNNEVILKKDYDIIKDVEISITAVIGETTISVEDLFSLKKGSIISLDANLNEPVNLYTKEKLVARGSIIAVDDSYGFRISEII